MTDKEILEELGKRIKNTYGDDFKFFEATGEEYRDAPYLQKKNVRIYRKYGNCWRFSDCKGVGFVDFNIYTQYRLARQFRMIDLVGDIEMIWSWLKGHYDLDAPQSDPQIGSIYTNLQGLIKSADKKVSGEYRKFAKKYLKKGSTETKFHTTPTQYFYYDGDESYETRTLEADLFHPSEAGKTCTLVFQVRRDTITGELSVWYFFRQMDVTGEYPELLSTTDYVRLPEGFTESDLEEVLKQYIISDASDLAGQDLSGDAVEALENLVEQML